MGKILAANHDTGSAMAMVPALKLLAERGHDVATLTEDATAPARKVFAQAELKPETLANDDIVSALSREKPSVVLVGVSDNSGKGFECRLITAAIKAEIPVVAIVESWPHNWMRTCADQVPIYRTVDRFMVFDKLSTEKMLEAGFRADQLIATGNPSLDNLAALRKERPKFREEYRERFGLKSTREMMLLVWAVTQDLDNEPTEGHPEWLGFKEAGALTEFLEAVRDAAASNPFCRAVVRQKPHYGMKTVNELIAKHCPGLAILDNEDVCLGRKPAVAGDVVFGTTTLLLELAAFCGNLAVSYLPGRAECDTKFTNQIGVTLPLYDRGICKDMVAVTVANPNQFLEVTSSLMRQVELPTSATENVADVLEGLIKH